MFNQTALGTCIKVEQSTSDSIINHTSPKKPLGNIILMTLILAGLGFLGNFLKVPLFFSVDFIFGSIFAFIALRKGGLTSALIVAICAGSYTYILWGHPYAAIIFFAEILTVGLLRKYISNYVYSDFLFWIFIGAPLAWIFYRYSIGLNETAVTLIVLKQPLNGLFNALVAALLIDIGIIITDGGSTGKRKVRVWNLTSNTLCLLTLTSGAIPLVIDSYDAVKTREEILHDHMENYSKAFFENPETSQLNRYVSREKVEDFFSGNTAILEGFNIAFLSQDGKIIYQHGHVKSASPNGTVQNTFGRLKTWQPEGKMANMRRWAEGEYYLKTTVILDDELTSLIISYSARPIVEYIEKHKLRTMVSLTILLLAALLVSRFLTSLLIGPITRLAETSASLKDKVGKESYFLFPDSSILEYDDLANSLQRMSESINKSFKKQVDLSNSLEERVKQRTAELERLSMVASQTTNAVVITDVNGIIEWVNEGFTRMTGFTTKEALNRTPGSFLQGPDTDRPTVSRINEAIQRGAGFHEELLNYHKDGFPYWTEITCTPILDQNQYVTGFIAIQNDITQRKKDLETLIEARKQAETANLAKTNFLSTMSHEIRTPLNGILGMAQLIANSELTTDQRDKINTIQQSGHTLLSIINDVLDMSKIEAGKIELETTAFSLSHMLSSSISALHSLAQEKGLRFRINETGTCPNVLMGDPIRIRQIIWNLLSNAIKFTDKGGVTVNIDCNSKSFNHFVSETRDTVIHLQIKDTGKGIDQKRQESIFDPFIQEDNTITRSYGGTGLGLSIVTNIIELMHGSIHLQSEVGQGSTFDVYLPLDKAPLEEIEKIEKINKESIDFIPPAHDILIAEDNPTNAMIARAFLEKFGQHVRIAENGRVAIQEIRKQRPDFVFMDIHMPEMNGIEATIELRKSDRYKDMPIIGLTAEAFADRHAEFMQAGMSRVITKPFTEIQLQKAIIEFLPEEVIAKSKKITTSNHHDFTEEAPALLIGEEGKLRETIDSLGIEAFLPVLAVAPENIAKQTAKLKEALKRKSYTEANEAVHAIKGISASLFASKLNSLCIDFEISLKERNLNDLDIDMFKEVVKQTNNWWSNIQKELEMEKRNKRRS